MALFRRTPPAPPPAPAPEPSDPSVRGKKSGPTPKRSQAEAARRQRVHRTLTKKEARAESNKQARVERLRAMSAREAAPEKALMRDYIDARFNIGEFLLPSLVVILALTFLSSAWPMAARVSTIAMYVFILLVLGDCWLMWRGFKKVLAQRLPKASPKGLALYGMNRAIQIRRFRIPAPRVKRGGEY